MISIAPLHSISIPSQLLISSEPVSASFRERFMSGVKNGFKVGSVRIMPADVLVGGVYVGFIALYVKNFIDDWCDKADSVTSSLRAVRTLRDRVIQRFIYTAQAFASSMLFLDWGVDKGWFPIKIAYKSVFKVFAQSISFLFWMFRSIECVQNLNKLPGLIKKSEINHLYTKRELEPEIYIQWLNLFSNFAFALVSVFEVLTLTTGLTVSAGFSSLLLPASIALMVASFTLDVYFGSSEKVNSLKLAFANPSSGYTLLK